MWGNGRPLFCQQPFLLFSEHNVLELKLGETENSINIKQDTQCPPELSILLCNTIVNSFLIFIIIFNIQIILTFWMLKFSLLLIFTMCLYSVYPGLFITNATISMWLLNVLSTWGPSTNNLPLVNNTIRVKFILDSVNIISREPMFIIALWYVNKGCFW